jgi:hypothetical protein
MWLETIIPALCGMLIAVLNALFAIGRGSQTRADTLGAVDGVLIGISLGCLVVAKRRSAAG